jgi:hypothetical protein
MAKVYRVHEYEVEPKSGVTVEDYENFLTQQVLRTQMVPGVKLYYFKGERGERTGKYLMVWEFESVERRDQLFPRMNQPSEEFQRREGEIANLRRQVETLIDYGPSYSWTDYIKLGEQV